MASLISWGKRLLNTANNDIVKPIQRDVVAPIAHVQAAVNNAPARALTTPVPRLGVSLGQVGAQIPTSAIHVGGGLARGALNAGDALLGGVRHLGDVANYGIQGNTIPGINTYASLYKQGKISSEVYSKLLNDAGNKAGFNIGDRGVTNLRKVAGAVAGPTAAILTADAAPAVFKGANLLDKSIAGAKLGALTGGAFGGIASLTQKGPVTPGGAALNVAGGALGGAALGAATPVAAEGAKKAGQAVANLGEGGYLKVPGLTDDPKWMAANDHVKLMNQNLEKMRAGNISPGSPQMKQATEATTAAIRLRDQIGKDLSQRGSVPLGPNLDNPQAVDEIKRGNASALAKSLSQDAQTKEAQTAIDRAATAKNNPVKVALGTVGEGGYQQAIANSQVVSKPVGTASGLFQTSMKALKKASPDEYKNFWSHVETPNNPNNSPELNKAIAAWRAGADRTHAGGVVLGKGVGYLQDYARHPWDLSGWEEASKGIGGQGVFTQAPRLHPTIAEGQAAGLKLAGDPLEQGTQYFRAASSQLRKDALAEGLTKADAHIPGKSFTLDLGNGKTVALSKEGFKEAGHLQVSPSSDNPAVKGYRAVNRQAKGALLSASQFHPVNVSALRAAPTLALEGHPIAAAKGLYGTFRAAFGTQYADQVIGTALKDGTVEKAARIGMPFGSSEWNSTTKTIGEHTVFGKQMPMMHNQVARSIIADLEKRNVPLDSAEARAAGKAGNNLMGFVNQETQGISPKVQRAMGDWLLAGQFTPAKAGNLADARLGGVAGSYARRASIANVAATAAVATGIGYLVKQKSDNIRDIALRALIDPAVPTPFKDAKGNTVKLRMPGTNTSDVAKLIGVKLVRQNDGHLGVNWNPQNVPSTVSDWLRSRLGPVPGAAVKLATNTTYAGKPLFDPNAPLGTKAAQAATTLGVGTLPIGLQGLAYTKFIKDHAPGSVKEILDANSPGTNPVIKSIGASTGFTTATDQTTGKALESSNYFTALSKAGEGLNSQEAAALKLYSGSKKNPVTGKYDVQPNVNDAATKASALLDNPKVIDKLITLNQTLSDKGQKVDPLWQLPKDQLTKVLQYQKMPPGGADRSHWFTQNSSWYQPLADARGKFFDSLPLGDPNKPKAPIEYPSASPQVAEKQKTFFALPDASSRAKFIAANPDLQTQLDNQVKYNNDMRVAQGYGALDTFPTATPAVQKIIDVYNAIPKGGGKKGGNLYRAQWIQSHPQEYAAMTKYFTQASLYGAQQSLTQAQFKDTGVDQRGLKDIYNLGQYDVSKQTDANGNTFYALGGDNSSKYASSGGSKKLSSTKFQVANSKAPKISGIKVKVASAKFKAPTTRKLAVSRIPSSATKRKLA